EVIVHENPEPVVTDADYVLTSTTADAYQWYKDNVIINGANSQTYTVSENGEYWVVVTNEFGCEGSSNRMIIVIESVENELSRVAKIYPNPAHDILKIDSDIALDKVEIYNAIGQLFYSMQPSENNLNINISEYEKGMYLVKLSAGNNSHTYRLIIE
ncbi:MAG TPA: T9SS type A sorting domain-containing protein, partial [Bacteroidales bacterium]|nr:T9SS type A sorting domain-containing protein [Bacteroidales bacterium]